MSRSASTAPAIRPVAKLMAANRSEIAVRIFRAGTELDLRTVAVFAEEDRFSIHRYKADESYQVGVGKGPVAAYLDIESIIGIAKEKGVDAIHPGYGFLSENAAFARACGEAGIVWVGPNPDLLEMMGDKTAARALAQRINVPVLPGTEEPVTDRKEAMKVAKQIGFPLIIKAAFGGGGRGMRIVKKADDLESLLDEAQGEAERAFGNAAVFLEKYIQNAKHIEVQILGDQHGNVIHLHERDCSVQRRHQKVIEVAPSFGLPPEVVTDLCESAARMAGEIGYDNAGTVEFLYDLDRHEWFFIEMNPRIQVEHTVTEVITGLDLVRAQILIAQGHALNSPEVGMPAQADVPRNGFALQCRITTEDPENKFVPDYGRLTAYRSPGGFGVRLDGAMGFTGAIITPFYDSMLVKVIASGQNYELALHRMGRVLSEFRIRGVKTNIPFLENVVAHPTFRTGQATTTLIDTTPELFRFKQRRDRATKLLNFIGDVVVNGNPHAKGYKPAAPLLPVPSPAYDHNVEPPAGSRQKLLELGAQGFADWTRKQKRLLITDTTFRDAHQSLMATRVRSYDMLACAAALAREAPQLFSLEMWGGATFDTAMRFLSEDPWERLRQLRAKVPNICFQMLFRGANAVGYTNYPDHVVHGFVRHAAANGMDIFRIFDSLNYLPNLRVAMEAVQDTHAICEGTLCYTGDILDPKRDKFDLKYYVSLAQELERMGAHMIAIKDMAGLCRPYAAEKLVKVLRSEVGVPIHFHTHDTSGINAGSILRAADAGVDVVDLALASMSGSTSQPNLNSIVAALQGTRRDTTLDREKLDRFSDYWENVRPYYAPFDTAPKSGSAEVYLHEMPGGQYTNLKAQAESMGVSHRWPEIARTYAEVNQLFGDIVKVTPSSKVVGDMALFLFSRGIKPADVVNLEAGATPFPESVIDMLSGGLGWPDGGFPADVTLAVLGAEKAKAARALYTAAKRRGLKAPKVAKKKREQQMADGIAAIRAELATKLKHEPSDDELYSHLMYPSVHDAFLKQQKQFGDVSVLPTPTFFYGLQPGEEISVEIEEGKVLIISLVSVGEPDQDGRRMVNYELNGMARDAVIIDKSVQPKTKAKPKADLADPNQVAAPIPGLVAALSTSMGAKVKKGEKLLLMEAMKMQTTVYSPCDGVVSELNIAVGDTVEAKDLLVRIKPA
ncbi:pyruvate carboxylase [Synoicihabitans lomoniglobus]|uniref:Pyruvate carboxylase n=1 Tax=Synoicihabitans lomoniglobus TaxID=2909285 RepID=A0AAF0CNM2_9BACT|nr:pyruvate carboxylase [Opitutaceae bacterium LMO-M01]WED64580.1 pyruvate carboxylase [Opitutaceae bacterium LMO-M01]